MLFNDEITLIKTKDGANNNGFKAKIIIESRDIFANRKDIRQSEFYQAAAQKIELKLMFEVRTEEYEGETIVKYKDSFYNVVRTYGKKIDITELVCSDKAIKEGELIAG